MMMAPPPPCCPATIIPIASIISATQAKALTQPELNTERTLLPQSSSIVIVSSAANVLDTMTKASNVKRMNSFESTVFLTDLRIDDFIFILL